MQWQPKYSLPKSGLTYVLGLGLGVVSICYNTETKTKDKKAQKNKTETKSHSSRMFVVACGMLCSDVVG